MKNLNIREPQISDEPAFLEMTMASKVYHSPWVSAPLTHQEFINYIQRANQPNQKSFLILLGYEIVGVFNLSEIVRGSFLSAYLGFYGSHKYAGKRLMSEGLKMLLECAFADLQLHRLEANIQPDNIASKRLVERNGFRKEGFSPRYLKINGEWRDHERWAITIEDWDS